MMNTFHRVFIDADKKMYKQYVLDVLGLAKDQNTLAYTQITRPLLSPNGLIIVDNTLWKGLVLEQVGHDFSLS